MIKNSILCKEQSHDQRSPDAQISSLQGEGNCGSKCINVIQGTSQAFACQYILQRCSILGHNTRYRKIFPTRISKRELVRQLPFLFAVGLRFRFRFVMHMRQHCLRCTIRPHGGVAKWLCSGLQSRLRRFDPDPRLQFFESAASAFILS